MRPVEIPGALVSFPAGPRGVPLDGFLARAPGGRRRPLVVYVHGMRSNFYRSRLKKELAARAAERGWDVLLFNNRGAGEGVATERFEDGAEDIAAALRFARRRGHRAFVLAGHSSGCQKIVHYLDRRRDPAVRGVVLLGPADDLAINRRELGPAFGRWVARARRLVAARRGGELLPACCQGFAARRFLSVADPRRTEAALFDYGGPMRAFGRLATPLLILFGAREEYACLPVGRMGAILRAKTAASDFTFRVIPGADHGFHGRERAAIRALLGWIDVRFPPDGTP